MISPNSGITSEFLYGQVSTVFVIAAALGSFTCGWLAERLGRRNSLLFNHVFAIIGGVITGLCVQANSPALLFVGRSIVGINCGLTIGIACLYLTEVSPTALRGAIGACGQLAITLGIVFAYVMTLTHTLNTETMWPIAAALCAVPAVVSAFILPFCPESPRWLYSSKKDVEGARKAFLRFNSKEDVDLFIGECENECENQRQLAKFKFTQLFTQSDLRMPILIACLIQVLQQLSGINAVISYSSTMLTRAGISEDYMQYCVFAIGVLNVIVTIISLPLLERLGRRTLLLWPTLLLALTLLLLTITVTCANTFTEYSKPLGIISVILILLYIIGFALGLGPVPALIVSEIFRQEPRAAAYALSQGVQWLANLLVLCSYPIIDAKIGGYSFLPFLVVVIVCWIFFFLFMPETRGRTFDEVARDLAFRNIVVGKRTTTLQEGGVVVYGKSDQNASNFESPATQRLLNTDTVNPMSIA